MCHGVIGLPPALLGPTPTPTHTRARVPLMHAFVPPRPLQGFTTAQKLDKLGMRGSDTCELLFENCEVPEEKVLGRENQVRPRADCKFGSGVEAAAPHSLCM